jgi:hypothetical protein
MAARADVLAGPAHYCPHDGLARVEFGGGGRVIAGSESDNLIVTITESKKPKRARFSWFELASVAMLTSVFETKYLANCRTAGACM